MMSSRGQEPDALSGLIAALSDPASTAKKLAEIKAAQDALDARQAKVVEAEREVNAKYRDITARREELAKESASLDEREAAIAKRERRADERERVIDADMARMKVDHAEVDKNRAALRDEFAGWQQDLDAQKKLLDGSEASLVALDKTLTIRANAIADKEAAAQAVMDEYKAKLAALKALVN
jgi:chromosome segregation ATPase